MERLDYYNKDKKNISAMMGHICQLLIYLSKTFNIPLRFPIFLNGSKSYILRSIKDKMSFLPLYFDAKKDDKHGNFENALNYLKDDIKEVFNFLSLFPEIISNTDNENANNMNGNYFFSFFIFIVYSKSLFSFFISSFFLFKNLFFFYISKILIFLLYFSKFSLNIPNSALKF